MSTFALIMRRRARLLLSFALCAAALLPAACTRPNAGAAVNSYAGEIEQWRAQRLANLKSEDGWLTLVGLFWLKEGANKFGSDTTNDIVIPTDKAPRFAGTLRLAAGRVKLETQPGVEITTQGKSVSELELQSDADGSPTVLNLGSLSFHIIRRGDKLGLRVKDRDNPARAGFRGLDYYPVAPNWRVVARFEPYNPPKSLPIMNVLGMEDNEVAPGAVAFDVAGQTYRLDAIAEKGESRLFIIFADRTSGHETYGAGRYLYADPPDASGRIVVDFNKAYSPPCAFTNYATCPLPPFQNRLPLSIEAGEKFAGH
jgi:uncharacterized protein (DUF1684 family)